MRRVRAKDVQGTTLLPHPYELVHQSAYSSDTGHEASHVSRDSWSNVLPNEAVSVSLLSAAGAETGSRCSLDASGSLCHLVSSPRVYSGSLALLWLHLETLSLVSGAPQLGSSGPSSGGGGRFLCALAGGNERSVKTSCCGTGRVCGGSVYLSTRRNEG